MKRQYALAAVFALTLATVVRAQDPALTRITLPGMECQGCQTKIAAALSGVPGVAQVVSADIQTRTAVVKPKPQTVLSPKALWEAMEKINQKPAKLEGPSGTYTEKPNS